MLPVLLTAEERWCHRCGSQRAELLSGHVTETTSCWKDAQGPQEPRNRPHLVMRFTVPLSELEAGQGRADLAIFCTLLQGRWEDRKITKKDQNRLETRLSPWRRQGSPGEGEAQPPPVLGERLAGRPPVC